ncbi:MAG TPA: OsmC family protein [Polyangia bacterium]
MIRTASAVWNGGLKDGKGTVSTETGTVSKANYNFVQRFENAPGTNPEELIAAAHASCYSMALSGALGGAGFTPTSVETKASLTLEKLDVGFTVTRIHLDVVAKVPNATPEQFLAAAEGAKRTCPISRLLNTTITLEAKLG